MITQLVVCQDLRPFGASPPVATTSFNDSDADNAHSQCFALQPMTVPDDAQLDIIINGAGLAGIAAATTLALHGHNVTVLESAKELAEIGAGLQITPNASKILQYFDLPQSFWDAGSVPTVLSVHRYTGKLLAQERNFDKNIMRKYGAPFIDMHRVDLQQAMYRRAKELGVKFVMNQRVASVETTHDTATVRAKSGHSFTGDLVVAADGLWSATRESFLGADAEPPKPTGDLAYRIILTVDQVASDPELKAWIENPEVHFWLGPASHVVAYSLHSGTMLNIVLLVPDDLPAGVARQPGSLEEMRELFNGWDPVLTKFLSKVETVDKWKLMHMDELPRWVNEHSNLVLIGDSCHPMLPYLAQGANSSIEDGAVLGTLLGAIKHKNQVPHALRMYEKLRKARGQAIVAETWKQRHVNHLPDGQEQEARDEAFLSQLGKEIKGAFPSRWTCPEVQPWLYGYDAVKEAQEALRREPLQP